MAQAAPARPNIIVILTDDQRLDDLRALPKTRARIGAAGTTHRLFMGPKNAFCMQKAVISVLAGDPFRKMPLTAPLTLFNKGVYYAMFTTHFASDGRGYLRRRRNARWVFNGGTIPQNEAMPST